MPTEEEVAACAMVIACTPLIDAPKLPPSTWHGLARSILECAEQVRADAKRRNCKHVNRQGTGMLKSDGTSVTDWYCQDCGKRAHHETPPGVIASAFPELSWN